MADVQERDALNLKKSLNEPLSDTDKLKMQRYDLAQKVASNESSGLLNKKLPNLHLFGGK